MQCIKPRKLVLNAFTQKEVDDVTDGENHIFSGEEVRV